LGALTTYVGGVEEQKNDGSEAVVQSEEQQRKVTPRSRLRASKTPNSTSAIAESMFAVDPFASTTAGFASKAGTDAVTSSTTNTRNNRMINKDFILGEGSANGFIKPSYEASTGAIVVLTSAASGDLV